MLFLVCLSVSLCLMHACTGKVFEFSTFFVIFLYFFSFSLSMIFLATLLSTFFSKASTHIDTHRQTQQTYRNQRTKKGQDRWHRFALFFLRNFPSLLRGQLTGLQCNRCQLVLAAGPHRCVSCWLLIVHVWLCFDLLLFVCVAFGLGARTLGGYEGAQQGLPLLFCLCDFCLLLASLCVC